ncbi:MAG: hypothetical protein LBS59_07615 [Puniceicoccales bacterium]|nr:hypothetical protein [Puniceicoccales bacterium]
MEHECNERGTGGCSAPSTRALKGRDYQTLVTRRYLGSVSAAPPRRDSRLRQ